MFNIEAVTVCVGYGDFLEETLRHNRPLLADWLIVTQDDDERTREACRQHSVRTLLTGDYGRRGEAFNKGRLIERGLQHLSANAWRLHLDADIVLPGTLHAMLEAADLDANCMYGCDRVMCRNARQWKLLQQSGWQSHGHHCQNSLPAGLQVGARWVHHESGYVPIGFFQLWHAQAGIWRGARVRPYPTNHNDACRTDVQHALQWDRRHRVHLPELVVVHLESEPCANGTNWKGRQTKPFIPYGA